MYSNKDCKLYELHNKNHSLFGRELRSHFQSFSYWKKNIRPRRLKRRNHTSHININMKDRRRLWNLQLSIKYSFLESIIYIAPEKNYHIISIDVKTLFCTWHEDIFIYPPKNLIIRMNFVNWLTRYMVSSTTNTKSMFHRLFLKQTN